MRLITLDGTDTFLQVEDRLSTCITDSDRVRELLLIVGEPEPAQEELPEVGTGEVGTSHLLLITNQDTPQAKGKRNAKRATRT